MIIKTRNNALQGSTQLQVLRLEKHSFYKKKKKYMTIIMGDINKRRPQKRNEKGI